MTNAPPDHSARALTAMLQRPDAACPACGHGLAGLDVQQCPECARPLSVKLAAGRERPTVPARLILWWALALGPIEAGSYLYMAYEMSNWSFYTPYVDPQTAPALYRPSFWEFLESSIAYDPLSCLPIALALLLSTIAAAWLWISSRPGANLARTRRVCIGLLAGHLAILILQAIV